jgi:transcription elongation factor GreB
MSKAFTREDAPDTPLVVPRRAPLPDDVPNNVTARGLGLLRAEQAALDGEHARLAAVDADDPERAPRLAVLRERQHALAQRLASAVLVDPRAQPQDEVRFGATVTVETGGGETRRYAFVGVDEAVAAHGRVAFLAPIARAPLGATGGDVVTLRTGRGEEELRVTAIAYDAE